MELALPEDRLIVLADRLDVFTEADMVLLTDASPETLKSWRKRGEGPAYAMVANRVLYPKTAVADWLKTRMRERRTVPATAVL